jgi:hypothetical protein
MSKSSNEIRKPTHDEISALAQRMYEKEGRPQGKATEHWLRAEAQLMAERKAAAGAVSAKSAPKGASAPKAAPAPAAWQNSPPAQPARTGMNRN